MVKTDLSLLRLWTILLLVLITSFIFFTILFVITPHLPAFENIYQFLSLLYQACFLLTAPFLLFYLIFFIPHIPFWMDHEQRRQAAASGDQRLLSVIQPAPDASALPLPMTIGLRADWSATLTALLGIPLCLGLYVLLMSHYFPDQAFDALLFIVSAILAVCLLSLLLWAVFSQKYPQITVTEEGLMLSGWHVRFISWQEARLFALVGLFAAKKHPSPLLFELASSYEVIRWTWLRPGNHSILSFVSPTAPPEEYNRQMQALLSLIAARTGLPLYDLRQKR